MRLQDKTFTLFIPEKEIQAEIRRVAGEINGDYQDRNPLFVGVLNGAFMFAADLMKNISIPCELTFVRVKSYAGTQRSGQVNTLIGLEHDIQQRHIIVLEDIVDTGFTLQYIKQLLQPANPASIEVATLLFKPEALAIPTTLRYVGLEIPNQFVVGYGLDYNGQGRNLRDLYQLKQPATPL